MTLSASELGMLLTLFLAWNAFLVGALKWALDKRFTAIEQAGQKSADVERQLLELRAQLPNEYVRREDWIRFSGVIDAKIDGIYSRFEALHHKLDRIKEATSARSEH